MRRRFLNVGYFLNWFYGLLIIQYNEENKLMILPDQSAGHNGKYSDK
jgi:hypothetical protein